MEHNNIEKINHEQRVQIVANEDYLRKMRAMLKYYKATRAWTTNALIFFVLALVWAVFFVFVIKNYLLALLSILLLLVCMYFNNTRQKMPDGEILKEIKDYLDSNGFKIDLQPEDTAVFLNKVDMGEFKDLINNYSVDEIHISPNRIRFENENIGGTIFEYYAEDIQIGPKGQKTRNIVFDGIIISLDRNYEYTENKMETNNTVKKFLEDDFLEIQIAPISKLGRLFQDTVSSISGSLADIRFSNEELNDVMSLKTENLINKSLKNQQLEEKFSSRMEEAIYQLYSKYGPFYMKIHKGKIRLAFNSGGLFNKNSLRPSLLPNKRIDENLLSVYRWGHLLYLIGVMENLMFNLSQMSDTLIDDKNKLASDFDDLLDMEDLTTDEIQELDKDTRTQTRVPFVLSDEKLKEIKEEYETVLAEYKGG